LRLKGEEREALLAVARSVVQEGKLFAVCAYGSKVAGYARPDSDYDIVVVATDFGEGVRYRYVEGPVPASALVVDRQLLMQDATSSFLGEFVVGRLLNVYEPLLNGEAFREAELRYKERVVAEALYELASDYGEFSRSILIPYDYFLFDKLKKRSMVYPPALYSYVMTYAGPLGPDNRRSSLDGFREAAKALVSRGYATAREDCLMIAADKLKGDSFTKLLTIFSLTTRGVAQYAVHGYAGRVGLNVFRKEALSKLKRMRERPDPPPELERPRSLLRLEEGRFIADLSELKDYLASLAGLKEYTAREESLGEPYTTTRVLTFTSGKTSASFVVKNFSDVRSLKWAILSVWALTARKFSMAPLARLEREYAATRRLREAGVRVPRVIAVAPDERTMVKEFVEGPTLTSRIDSILSGDDTPLRDVEDYGALLSRVHSANLALGDSKANNVVISAEGLCLTDLEQATEGGDFAWDIAEFLYYSAKLSLNGGRMEKVARAFLEGYCRSGDRSVLARSRGIKYLAPFQPFLSPGMSGMIRGLLDEYSQPLLA